MADKQEFLDTAWSHIAWFSANAAEVPIKQCTSVTISGINNWLSLGEILNVFFGECHVSSDNFSAPEMKPITPQKPSKQTT